jgi:hypothetical protein
MQFKAEQDHVVRHPYGNGVGKRARHSSRGQTSRKEGTHFT